MRAVVAAFALAALALPGCYSYAPMTVAVRDRASQEPIAGAHVSVSNTSLLNPVKPDAAEADTDEAGLATLHVAAYNRLLVRVRVEGRPDHLVNGDHPREWGATDWFSPVTDEAGGRATIELRLAP